VKYSGLYPDLWEWDLPALFDYRRAGEDGKTRLEPNLGIRTA